MPGPPAKRGKYLCSKCAKHGKVARYKAAFKELDQRVRSRHSSGAYTSLMVVSITRGVVNGVWRDIKSVYGSPHIMRT